MKMPFGKYKGFDVSELPIDYMRWLETQDWIRQDLRDELNHEIEKYADKRPGKGKIIKAGDDLKANFKF